MSSLNPTLLLPGWVLGEGVSLVLGCDAGGPGEGVDLILVAAEAMQHLPFLRHVHQEDHPLLVPAGGGGGEGETCYVAARLVLQGLLEVKHEG